MVIIHIHHDMHKFSLANLLLTTNLLDFSTNDDWDVYTQIKHNYSSSF